MTNHDSAFIDNDRTACLCTAGSPDYLAAVVIGADGEERLVLAKVTSIGDPDVGVDLNCTEAVHEQSGPLPLEIVRRITIAVRTHRCGRRTKTTGRPCRIEVSRSGDPCGLHRGTSDTETTNTKGTNYS